jgi:glycosyltransferase involved in cell wall biosynthesis
MKGGYPGLVERTAKEIGMAMSMRFATALRDHARKKIEQLQYADIVIGIPAYFSGQSIVHVIQTVAKGLEKYYHDAKALIFVSDGGSTDDTREIANLVSVNSYNIEKIVTLYRGVPGKGSGFRAVFEVARFMEARAVAVFDSDLMYITPEWVKNVLEPVFAGYDYVAPDYHRYKLDGTITNTIAYNLTRALYGYKVRQPIGGDFGISQSLIRHFLDQNVWETDVARFGVDIWMTTVAIVGGFKICQARLGAKIHGEKDPSADLGPMFRQVVGTIFQLMEVYQDYWKGVKGSREVPTLGDSIAQEPKAFEIDQNNLIEYFQLGFRNFGGLWERILEKRDFRFIEALAHTSERDKFLFPVETWVRTVYRYMQAFHTTPRQKFKVLDTLLPLYNARVASLVNELREKDVQESERHFEANARAFEDRKDYLLEIWDREDEHG